MIDRYYSPRQVMELLGVSKSRAYEIFDQMPCLQRPLRVSERALKEWIAQNTKYPAIAGRKAG
jgi:predicted DNA-binding transcriptional regulator AlpA